MCVLSLALTLACMHTTVMFISQVALRGNRCAELWPVCRLYCTHIQQQQQQQRWRRQQAGRSYLTLPKGFLEQHVKRHAVGVRLF